MIVYFFLSHSVVYYLHFIQGVLIGSLCAMLLVTWISIGRMSVDITDPSLPLTSVDRCPAAVTNDTSLWKQYVTTDWTSTSSATESYVTQVVFYLSSFFLRTLKLLRLTCLLLLTCMLRLTMHCLNDYLLMNRMCFGRYYRTSQAVVTTCAIRHHNRQLTSKSAYVNDR